MRDCEVGARNITGDLCGRGRGGKWVEGGGGGVVEQGHHAKHANTEDDQHNDSTSKRYSYYILLRQNHKHATDGGYRETNESAAS